jgi:hypothetical protein
MALDAVPFEQFTPYRTGAKRFRNRVGRIQTHTVRTLGAGIRTACYDVLGSHTTEDSTNVRALVRQTCEVIFAFGGLLQCFFIDFVVHRTFLSLRINYINLLGISSRPCFNLCHH